MAKLTGTNPGQVPTNGDLGTMAYQDKDNVRVSNVTVSDVPLEAANQYGNLLVKSDVNDKAIFLEQNDGNRNWQIGVNNTGDLQFFNSGDSNFAVMINDANQLYVDPVSVGLAAVYGQDNNVYYVGVAQTRARFGYDGGDAVVQGTAGKGVKILADDATFGSGKGIIIPTTGEVKVTTGLLELDGNDIGGTQVTIADDAVASITPPRKGGFMFVTCGGEGDYPSVELSGGMLYYDVGVSLRMDKGSVFGSPVSTQISTTTADVTGTTGSDGNMTVAAQSGVIKIENRNGGSRTFQVTFL